MFVNVLISHVVVPLLVESVHETNFLCAEIGFFISVCWSCTVVLAFVPPLFNVSIASLKGEKGQPDFFMRTISRLKFVIKNYSTAQRYAFSSTAMDFRIDF